MKLIDLSTPDGVAAEALARMNRADEELRDRLARLDAERRARDAEELHADREFRRRMRRNQRLTMVGLALWIVGSAIWIASMVLR